MIIKKFAEIRERMTSFGTKVGSRKVPNNEANKIMSLILTTLAAFELVVTRFRQDRNRLREMSWEDYEWFLEGRKENSKPRHPDQEFVHRAIQVDIEMLFVYALILVTRVLLLLRLALPDKLTRRQWTNLAAVYEWIKKPDQLSPLARRLRSEILGQLKWLYSVLRFYRNEFIEHLDRSYQQGMVLGYQDKDLAIYFYKWDLSEDDLDRLRTLNAKLVTQGITLPDLESNPRQFVQHLFDNVASVPDDLLKESLELIEDFGAHSPNPFLLIERVREYLLTVFQFLDDEFASTEFARYPPN